MNVVKKKTLKSTEQAQENITDLYEREVLFHKHIVLRTMCACNI